MPRFIAALLAALALLMPAPAQADHLRTVTVRQIAANGTQVTIRNEFNFSGNCCGGAFTWTIGDTTNQTGSVFDGLSGGVYQGDQALTTGTLSGGTSFTWSRLLVNPSTNLVRIDITWSYAASGTYMVTWTNCCPQSNNMLPVTTDTTIEPKRILVVDNGANALDTAFADAQIPVCPLIGTPTDPLCYEPKDATSIATANPAAYSSVVVGSSLPVAMVTTLTAPGAPFKTNFASWLGTGSHGIAMFGQNNQAAWGWIPDGGGTITGASGLANDVTVTVKGMAHTSHLNQLPTVLAVPGTLADWNVSALNNFTSTPAYFTNVLGTALAETSSSGQVVAVGAHYGSDPGCEVLTGQPVDDRAGAGVFAAQQLFRAMIEYTLACVDPAQQ